MTKALFFAYERIAMLRLCEKYFQFQEIAKFILSINVSGHVLNVSNF